MMPTGPKPGALLVLTVKVLALAVRWELSVFLQSVIFELSIGKKPPLPPMNWQILR
jgi:hypothetical protein